MDKEEVKKKILDLWWNYWESQGRHAPDPRLLPLWDCFLELLYGRKITKTTEKILKETWERHCGK